MTMNRHEPFEELISASLQGDLTADERRRLDAHLDGCDQCRQTLAAFSDQRRILAGLRHVAPPRDLGARVRAGVESASIPWWRKPTTIFTAVGGTPGSRDRRAPRPRRAQRLAVESESARPRRRRRSSRRRPPRHPSRHLSRFRPSPRRRPSTDATPGEPTPAARGDPHAGQLAAAPEPDMIVAFQPATPAGNEQSLTVVDGSTGDIVAEPESPGRSHGGRPVSRSPPSCRRTGPSSRCRAARALSGMDQVLVDPGRRWRCRRPDASAEPTPTPPAAIGETTVLGTSVAGSPFLEHLAWSSDSRWLAYTLADPNGGGTDAWVFDTADERVLAADRRR